MRRITAILAAVTTAVVVLTVLSGRDGDSTAAASTKTTAKKLSTATSKKASTLTSLDAGRTGGTKAEGDATSTTLAGAATVVSGGSSIVYRLTTASATVSGTHVTFYSPSSYLTSTTGTGRQRTAAFVSRWTNDPLASSLSGIVLTADGVRHAVTVSYPSMSGGTLSLVLQSSSTISQALATETGVGTTGAVAGVSGTLSRPTLFLALASGRVVNGCQLTSGTNCDGINLAQTSLESADLSGASLRQANLWQAGLHGSMLTGADLSGAGAYRADLSDASGAGITAVRLRFTQGSADGADFSNGVFTGAQLRRADLSGTNFSGAQLRRAKLTDAFAKGADFAGADLTGAKLMSADLTGADFRNADLRGADLAGANLTGADLTGADLTGANLDGAIVKRASFAGASFGATKCVDGIVRNSCAG